MTHGRVVEIEAPAKINLGLEILGRRRDGFHEIRTVMTMVDLADRLRVGDEGLLQPSTVPGVADAENLITRALAAYRATTRLPGRSSWWLEKRIPVAGGLGGASSDAAAALRAANTLADTPLARQELHRLAASLGSDIPFFLHYPAALASGTGTDLKPLPVPPLELLLLVPAVHLAHKTRTLYGHLEPADFTDGRWTARFVLEQCDPASIPGTQLRNAFSRALCSLVPRIRELQLWLERTCPYPWGLSGAGPVHYVIVAPEERERLRGQVERAFPGWISTVATRTRTSMPEPDPVPGVMP